MEKGIIHFTPDQTIDSFENIEWNIGDSYEIEFFEGKQTKVYLFDANSDIEEYVNIMQSDPIIFTDFEYVPPNFKAPPICLFSFCCSSGVYIFKQTESEPNKQLKDFLMNQRGITFVGKKIRDIFNRLKQLFGKNFYFNYNDIILNRLPNNKLSFYDIILKYYGEPKINFSKSSFFNWSKQILSMKQVMSSAFDVFALSLCYPNLPPEPKKSNNSFKEIEISHKGNLQFISIPENIKNKPFKIGESYKIKFYSDSFTPVYLLDANSNLGKYIKMMTSDPIIYVDFEHVPKAACTKGNKPTISLFTFCCSSGVFIFRQIKEEPNDQLEEFLSKENGNKFVGYKISSYIGMLNELFGDNFLIDIENVSETRFKNIDISLSQIIKKYASAKPAFSFQDDKIRRTNWNRNNLSMEQVIYTSYVAYNLSRCYKNMPQIKRKNVSKSFGQIQFTSETPLSSFKKKNWLINQTAEIEFFPDTFTPVYLLNANTDLKKYIPIISKDPVIFIDFEYVPFKQQASPICLFQFCCSSGAFLFRQLKWTKNKTMRDFLSKENGLKFVGKGISGDLNRLRILFGKDFDMNIEDVEQTRLYPYEESVNFDQMVEKFAGEPTAQFKDKKISCSNWNAENLEMIQVIYSAFDVVALYNCYPNFRPSRCISYQPPNEDDCEPQGDLKERLIQYSISEEICDKNDFDDDEKIDAFWDSNSELVTEMLNLNLKLLQDVILNGMCITVGHKFKCKKCQKSRKYLFFKQLMDHCKKCHSNQNEDDEEEEKEELDLKTLFLHYLNNSGRIVIEARSCFLCMKKFKKAEKLCDHCWNKHYQLLGELTLQQKTTKEEEGENDSDDDYDENNINDDDDDENNSDNENNDNNNNNDDDDDENNSDNENNDNIDDDDDDF
ncbi:hypothetical protein M9Y10_028916 [Tritrichomonas musculus]|uniref:C2H2-type domain-containing protein n=1 Tax=Tritrichomonas musculus TaxID=1915356 RepID=A0ABR2KLT4_9EUKA